MPTSLRNACDTILTYLTVVFTDVIITILLFDCDEKKEIILSLIVGDNLYIKRYFRIRLTILSEVLLMG